MPSKIAVLVLNRNLPAPTDALCERFVAIDRIAAEDIFVVEAGSDDAELSRYCTWHVTTPEVVARGLRFSRGFNYALRRIYLAGRLRDYDYFFLLTNDTRFEATAVIAPLVAEMESHPRLGMLSPCAPTWGELSLLVDRPTKYFWYVHNTAHLLRRTFVESMMNADSEDLFLYDGTNFRGYGAETELIAKGYANDWATGITRLVSVDENEAHLREHSSRIRTESYEDNLKLYLEEGARWVKLKYGFTNRWQLQMYAQNWYDRFFQFHPECGAFRI